MKLSSLKIGLLVGAVLASGNVGAALISANDSIDGVGSITKARAINQRAVDEK